MKIKCPKCGSKDYDIYDDEQELEGGWMVTYHSCDNCGCLYDVHIKMELEEIRVRDE